MKCNHAEKFFDRLHREGERFDRPDVAAHVGQCDHCSRAYEKWCAIARILADTPVIEAPPALYGNVMRSVDARQAGGRLQWFPLQLKLPVYGMAFAALILITGYYLFIARPSTIEPTVPGISSNAMPAPKVATVHFEIALVNAHQVAIVGDFNGWNKEKHLLTKADGGFWKIDLPLPKGCYQYQFLIDGKRWHIDPGRTQLVPDGFGGFNTVIEI